ncbi:micronuclear linker histone polyprotein [Nematostella vectensis]|uniref:micronuclear linker histone polyprotein n=1 Tax=Nematostella vectensis TaxID=45351 RepID=UPI0020770683|nr:micronuclear linker histone polyprotein [Nematostella vectensis]
MRVYTLVLLVFVVFMTLCMFAEVEGWFGGRRGSSRSSSSRSSSRSVSRSSSRGGSGGRRTSSSRSTSVSSRRTRPSSRKTSVRKTSSSRRGGWFGGRRSSSSKKSSVKKSGGWFGSRKSPKKTTPAKKTIGGYSYTSKKSPRGKTITVGKQKIHVGKTGIRDRDETGHRTGLGTLARETIKNPKKTIKAIKEFAKSYADMRKKNLKGGNLAAHREANKKATQKANSKVAGAISAIREQYKNFRVKKNPDGSIHLGDTRTKKERDATMNANKKGREDANKG